MAAEVVKPQRSDYYQSTRAVGYLYRDISLPPIEDKTSPDVVAAANGVGTDNVSAAALSQVRRFLPEAMPTDAEPAWLTKLFQEYLIELRYVSATHTISHTADARLTEEEIVVGWVSSSSPSFI